MILFEIIVMKISCGNRNLHDALTRKGAGGVKAAAVYVFWLTTHVFVYCQKSVN